MRLTLILLLLAIVLPLAALDQVTYPPAKPAVTAAGWLANPPAAAQAAGAQAAATAATAPADAPWWQNALVIAGGAVGLLLTVGKKLPGIAGALATVGDMAFATLAPGAYRAADKQKEVAADGLATLVHLIQVLPNDGTISDLKAKIQARMPSPAKDLINQLVTDLESRGVSTPMILTTTPISTIPA